MASDLIGALRDCAEYLEDMATTMDIEDTDTNCLAKYDGDWCGSHCRVHGCMNMRIQRARAALAKTEPTP